MASVIVFVSSMQGGGAERVTALLANHWAAKGHQVCIVATFSGGGECLYALSPNVELLFLSDLVRSTKRSLRNQLQRFVAIRKLVRRRKPHAIVSFLSVVNVAVLLATRGLGVRTVVSERTYPPQEPLGFVLDRLRAALYARADGVVMQTAKSLQWLKAVSPKARGTVIHNPVSHPLPKTDPVVPPDSVVADDHVILAVGRLTPIKGFDKLINAFAEITEPGWVLVVLGEGPSRAELQAQIQEQGLSDRIMLVGRVGNVADWYDRAELFVLSSRYEGFPNSLLEAMSHGLAVISFACDTGPADIIEHERNGLLIEPDRDVSGLTDAMQRLMADAEQRRALAARAIEVRERFAIETVGEQWEVLLGITNE